MYPQPTLLYSNFAISNRLIVRPLGLALQATPSTGASRSRGVLPRVPKPSLKLGCAQLNLPRQLWSAGLQANDTKIDVKVAGFSRGLSFTGLLCVRWNTPTQKRGGEHPSQQSISGGGVTQGLVYITVYTSLVIGNENTFQLVTTAKGRDDTRGPQT